MPPLLDFRRGEQNPAAALGRGLGGDPVSVAIILAGLIFLLVIATLVVMHSALRAGRALNAEIKRVTEGRER